MSLRLQRGHVRACSVRVHTWRCTPGIRLYRPLFSVKRRESCVVFATLLAQRQRLTALGLPKRVILGRFSGKRLQIHRLFPLLVIDALQCGKRLQITVDSFSAYSRYSVTHDIGHE